MEPMTGQAIDRALSPDSQQRALHVNRLCFPSVTAVCFTSEYMMETLGSVLVRSQATAKNLDKSSKFSLNKHDEILRRRQLSKGLNNGFRASASHLGAVNQHCHAVI